MHRSAILSVWFITFAAAGCTGASPGSVENSNARASIDPVVNDRVHVIDPSASVDTSPDRLVFHDPSADIQAMRPGDLVVSAAAQGFLRRVLSVDHEGDTLVVSTSQASLEDAIVEGGAHTSSDLRATSVQGGIHPMTNVDITPFSYSVGNLSVAPDLNLQVNGTIELRPKMDLDLEIHHGKVSKFRALMSADLEASSDLKLIAAAQLSGSYSATLATSPPIVLVQWIGAVPVVETVTISLVATAQASVSAAATVDIGGSSLQASFQAGAEYDDGNWHPIFAHDVRFANTPPAPVTAQVTAGAGVSLDLRAQILLYGVAGPYVDIGPYVQEQVTASPPAASGRVGLQGHFGGELQVLGNTVVSYSVPLFDVGQDF